MDPMKIDDGDFFPGPIFDFYDNLEGFSVMNMPDDSPNTIYSLNNDPSDYMMTDQKNDYISTYSPYGEPKIDINNKLNSFKTDNIFKPTKYDMTRDRAIKMRRIENDSNNGDYNLIKEASFSSEPQIIVVNQPPVEVRTRTPSEKRSFSCSVIVKGDLKACDAKFVTVELLYAPNSLTGEENEIPKQTILGGTKTVAIKPNGVSVFENLSMSEGSIKHKEKEFCLRFILVDKNGNRLKYMAHSTPFYAYSNTKVLSRRREIHLRALSQNFGPLKGGVQMHVIGLPFIKGPSLKLIFRTPHGDVSVTDVELFSETVLFFTLPEYPGINELDSSNFVKEIKVEVMVTNDGRNLSNPLEFYYVPVKHEYDGFRSFL